MSDPIEVRDGETIQLESTVAVKDDGTVRLESSTMRIVVTEAWGVVLTNDVMRWMNEVYDRLRLTRDLPPEQLALGTDMHRRLVSLLSAAHATLGLVHDELFLQHQIQFKLRNERATPEEIALATKLLDWRA